MKSATGDRQNIFIFGGRCAAICFILPPPNTPLRGGRLSLFLADSPMTWATVLTLRYNELATLSSTAQVSYHIVWSSGSQPGREGADTVKKSVSNVKFTLKNLVCYKMTVTAVNLACRLQKCNFILMQSTNLDRFQQKSLVRMRIASCPIKRDEEIGESSNDWVAVEECLGEKIIAFDLAVSKSRLYLFGTVSTTFVVFNVHFKNYSTTCFDLC